MTANHGNIRLLLKLALAAAVVVALVVLGLQRLSDTAVVQAVTRGTAVSAVPGSVLVTADKGIRELKNEVPGRVASCEALDPGHSFKKGDVLLQLDTSELDREMKLAEEGFKAQQEKRKFLLETNHDRELAEKALATGERLQKQGDVSADRVEELRRGVQALKDKFRGEEIDNDKAKTDFENGLESKRILKKKMSVVAQEDGMVSGVLVAPGALINAGQPVATIMSNGRVVTAKISEENFGAIKVGQKAKVRLLIYGSAPPFDAVVSKLLPNADEATQLYTVFLDVAVDPVRLVPGSNGQVTITVAERPNQPLVPRRALFNGSHVFVVKDGRVQLRKLDICFISLSNAEVLGGLVPGELVIVENIDQFRDGQRVRLATEK